MRRAAIPVVLAAAAVAWGYPAAHAETRVGDALQNGEVVIAVEDHGAGAVGWSVVTDCSNRYVTWSGPGFLDPAQPRVRLLTADGRPVTVHCSYAHLVALASIVRPDGSRSSVVQLTRELAVDSALGVGSAAPPS